MTRTIGVLSACSNRLYIMCAYKDVFDNQMCSYSVRPAHRCTALWLSCKAATANCYSKLLLTTYMTTSSITAVLPVVT
jgi:hypothetical protein